MRSLARLRRRRPNVTMIVSVGELVAGEAYRVPAEQADTLIVKGYAAGELSRPYSDAERQALRSTQQTVEL